MPKSCSNLILIVLSVALAGCFFGKDEPEVTLSGAQQFYNRADTALKNGDYNNAIAYFEVLEARYPFSNLARQGQLDLIYAYYKDRQPESVIDATRQFERENPTHPRIDYILYMRGMALFSGEKDYFHELFNVNISKRPPKDARNSYAAFAELVRRFPNSRYTPDARQRMLFLRNRVAEHENHIARYYLERGAYAAALSRANYTLQVFDGAPTTPETLQIMITSYRKLGLHDLAEDSERVLARSFPEIKALPPLEIEDKSWYKFW